MNDNNNTRTPAELQEWLAEVERNYRWDETSGRLEHNYYGGEYMPHSARSIPRLCQELRRAWARIADCYKAIDELVGREAKAEEAMLAPTPYLDKVSTERTAATLKQYGIDWPAEREAPHD